MELHVAFSISLRAPGTESHSSSGFCIARGACLISGEGVAGRNSPLRWVAEDGIAGCSGGGGLPPFGARGIVLQPSKLSKRPL